MQHEAHADADVPAHVRGGVRRVYAYDAAFQNMAASGSAYAARRIVSAMRTILPVRSVVDFGCARATWLREWQSQDVDDCIGVDGDYVDRGKLAIDPQLFVATDLALPFRLERRFDLAQSLEVAEHLPPARADGFVADIVAHAPVVLFSAAAPGQGGEHHLNERPAAYWQALFRAHDFLAIDCLRPLLGADRRLPAWYRYNLILYVQRCALDTLDPFARQFLLREGERLVDLSPLPYRLRKLIVRSLPKPVCDQLARWNARRFPPA